MNDDILTTVKAALDAHDRGQCGCLTADNGGVIIACRANGAHDWLRALVERCDLLADQLRGIQTCGHERRYELGRQLAECVRCELEAAETRIKSLVERCERAEQKRLDSLECVRHVVRQACRVARIQAEFADDLGDRDGDIYEQFKDFSEQFYAERAERDALRQRCENAETQKAQLALERDNYRIGMVTARRESGACEERAFRYGYDHGWLDARSDPDAAWADYKERTR